MRNGIIGGLLLGGLLAGAILGLVPGAILMGIGGAIAALGAAEDAKKERNEESWLKCYPPYRY